MTSSPTIIFEDPHLLAINKPGAFHSTMGEHETSVAAWLKSRYPNLAEASPKPEDWGLVNRLDYETSGILLAAKDRDTWESLKALGDEGKVNKIYLAVVQGVFKDSVVIENFIGARGRNSPTVRIFKEPRKKDRALFARTSFSPIKTHPDKNISVIQAEIALGRRHQIRIHAQAAGHPLVGDTKYGGAVSKDFPTFLLHAWKVEFLHPVTLKQMTIEAPLPEKFQKLVPRPINSFT